MTRSPSPPLLPAPHPRLASSQAVHGRLLPAPAYVGAVTDVQSRGILVTPASARCGKSLGTSTSSRVHQTRLAPHQYNPLPVRRPRPTPVQSSIMHPPFPARCTPASRPRRHGTHHSRQRDPLPDAATYLPRQAPPSSPAEAIRTPRRGRRSDAARDVGPYLPHRRLRRAPLLPSPTQSMHRAVDDAITSNCPDCVPCHTSPPDRRLPSLPTDGARSGI
ncbi:hypothetical protein B0H19DRAFT_602984 [Mycena capillaripes]|nr:hypothetical protein B0H19DRAFT_602984 [Mycena capillaripes]